MLTLSTTTATPSTSKTWSSSLALSKASAYWKPEQPPPRTATRSACPSASSEPPSRSPIFSAALAVRLIASWGVSVPSVTSQSVARGVRVAVGLKDWRAVAASQPTAVVCDSTAYLPAELLAAKGIEMVSLYVAIDGDQRRETEIGDYGQFFERLRASESGATTSQPSIGDFVAAYEPLLAEDREVVSVHISAGISGTFEAANQARQRLIDEDKGGERIHVYDSRSAAGGMGLCALGAAAAAAAGESGEGTVARAELTRQELKMWFAIDTLEYLKRGGRIGGAAAWIGSALKIKPILTLEEEITPVERVRTRARSIERLRGYMRERHESGLDAWVVQHIQDDETANALIEDCYEIFGCEPAFCSEVGPVLGAHVGPGLLGAGSVSKSVLS